MQERQRGKARLIVAHKGSTRQDACLRARSEGRSRNDGPTNGVSSSDIPASDSVPIPVRYRSDTLREIGPTADQQTFVGFERKSDRLTDRIVEQFVER